MNSVPGVVAAIDTGGTFTDLVATGPGGQVWRLKVPSTPDDPARAVLQVLGQLASLLAAEGEEATIAEVRHGTTVATNALLERQGARVLLITTAGFEDVLRLRRQARPDLYACHPQLPEPLVPPERCLGVRERLGPGGQVWADLADPETWIDSHRPELEAAEAVAICLLHAGTDDRHEARLGAALRATLPNTPVTLSSEVAPVLREYERCSTAVINATVAPIMGRYLRRLQRGVAPARLHVEGSAGGLLPVRQALEEPVQTVLSGPAGGVRGAWLAGRRAGMERLLTLDMGGTSTDVSLVLGELEPEDDGQIADHPLRIPLLPIETVGAGGGSVAWIDSGGALKVGPRSAGAVPGPAAYGRGGVEATVTDAHVVLGRIETLLGGEMVLDRSAAHAAIAALARRLGSSVSETAAAIVAIASANMGRACKRVTMARGVDPRTLTLVAFGGAGGLHACELAEELGCLEVLFPAESGVLSAEGICAAPAQASVTRTLLLSEALWQHDGLGLLLADVRNLATERLREGWPELPPEQVTLRGWADCRYHGQSRAFPVPLEAVEAAAPGELRAGLRRAFDGHHRDRYGYALPATRPVELVALRCEASGPVTSVGAPVAAAAGWQGPRVLATWSATLWLPAGWQAERLPHGDLRCQRGAGERTSAGATVSIAIGLEIHRQRMAAIAEQMGEMLISAAFSANIKERHDLSCALFDQHGELVEHAAHIPVHLGSTTMSVAAAIAAVPMRPGQHVIVNDPFAGGTHLPDVTLITPVFVEAGQPPAFFVANRAHHADVGGLTPGSMPAPFDEQGRPCALTIYDEGYRLGPTVLTDAVRATFAAASRTPDERAGDLRAQEAANDLGVRLLQDLVAEQGLQQVRASNVALQDHAERRMRALIAALPDGQVCFADALDDDGIGSEPLPIAVELRVHGERVEVDLRRCADASSGPLNAVRAVALSAVFYVFRSLAGALVDGDGVMPANSGMMRPITVLTRPGSLLDAAWPAAVSGGNVETSQRLVDALFGALAQVAPEHVAAASCGSMNNILFGGVDLRPGPHSGRPWVHYETLGGGAGGGPAGPGAHGIHVHMTNTRNTPVEALEHAFPVRIERYALRPCAAVEGEASGGAGIVRRYRFLAPAIVTLLGERRRLAPWALGGGRPGQRGRDRLWRVGEEVVELPGKVTLRVKTGDMIEVATPGGGGYRKASPSTIGTKSAPQLS